MPDRIAARAPANLINGPHEQGRAAIEFYTEEVTVYRDA